MSTSHDDSVSINRAIRDISCRYIHVSMTSVAFNCEHDVLLGSKNKVAIALLGEWIDHDCCWNSFRQIVIFASSLGSNIISTLILNVYNNIDIALYTPVMVELTELESNTVVNEMSGWFFLDNVEILVKGDMSVHFDVLVLIVDDDLDVSDW